MPQAAFFIPGDLQSPTGGYAYDRHVLRLIGAHGVDMRHVPLAAGYPFPDRSMLEEARSAFAALDPDCVAFLDGLAYGAMPLEIIDTINGPIVPLVHHPLAHETGLGAAQAKELFNSERAALQKADRIIVTGVTSLKLLSAEYGVPPDKITLAVPGTEARPRAHGSGSPLRLLAVGAVSPRKGYGHLIEALASLGDGDWQLDLAGSLSHDPAEAERLATAIAHHGLGGKVHIHGAVDEGALADLYRHADVFVLPSLFEGFGMVLTEALAYGIAIVTTRVGAAEGLVPDDAAIKVPPGDTVRLAGALSDVIANEQLRRDMSDAAWRAARHLPRWNDTARIIAGVMKELCP
ncbi:MAG: hypothetical protein RLZ98_2083 [Pseudomonadota bacterium]